MYAARNPNIEYARCYRNDAKVAIMILTYEIGWFKKSIHTVKLFKDPNRTYWWEDILTGQLYYGSHMNALWEDQVGESCH